MAAISQLTSRIRLGQMVGCTSYRNPALLAKITSTVDVDLGRSPQLGHRRRLVRERVPQLRLRVPEAGAADQDARGDRRDRHPHVDRADDDVQGRALRGEPCLLRSQAAAAAPPAGADRRRRRAADAPRRGQARRQLELRRQPRAVGAQARGAEGALRVGRARLRRDPAHVVARGVHPGDRGRGAGRRTRAASGASRRRAGAPATSSARPSRCARSCGRTSTSASPGSSRGAPTTPTPRR